MKFSEKEIVDLIKAWFLISLAFAILFSGGLAGITSFTLFLYSFIISGLTVGISFLVHELCHKFFAMRYGFEAEFRSFDKMLFLAVAMSFFGFILAAPGAVMIKAFGISKEKNGKISLSGSASNIFLAFIFLFLMITIVAEGFLETFLIYGLRINALLAVFNFIPAGGFDGRKIYEWNQGIWIVGMAVSALLFILSFWILPAIL